MYTNNKNFLKMNQLIRQRKIYSYFVRYSYFIMLKCLGLVPCQLHISNVYMSKNKNNIKNVAFLSYYGSLYNIFLVIMACFWSSQALTMAYVETVIAGISSWSVGIFIAAFGNFSVIMIWFYFIFWQKTIVRTANRLVHINTALMQYNNYNSMDRKIDIILVLVDTTISLILFIFGSVSSGTTHFLQYLIPSVVCRWVLTEYTIILILITQIFCNLNTTLLKLGGISTDIQFHVLFVTKKFSRDLNILDIMIVRRTHRTLCEIFHEISEFFAFPILLIILYVSGCCVFSAFFILLTVFTNIPSISIGMRINGISWFVTELVSLIVMATGVTKIMREVKIFFKNILFLKQLTLY